MIYLYALNKINGYYFGFQPTFPYAMFRQKSLRHFGSCFYFFYKQHQNYNSWGKKKLLSIILKS